MTWHAASSTERMVHFVRQYFFTKYFSSHPVLIIESYDFSDIKCTPIRVPDGVFERVAVYPSKNSSDGVVFSYEYRDWRKGDETRSNTIAFNDSLIRVPSDMIGYASFNDALEKRRKHLSSLVN
jgi:hypothetical protein